MHLTNFRNSVTKIGSLSFHLNIKFIKYCKNDSLYILYINKMIIFLLEGQLYFRLYFRLFFDVGDTFDIIFLFPGYKKEAVVKIYIFFLMVTYKNRNNTN